jgi:DNA polymerase-4
LVEPLSLDEAFLDVTKNKQAKKSAIAIARDIKRKIYGKTELTCTAGVSVNKFLAKIASGMNKPDGLTVIMPEEVENFVAQIPIEKFYGIGKVTADKMKALGIFTGADLRKRPLVFLTDNFGKAGKYFFDASRGIDNRPVDPTRIRKSVSIERTFEEDVTTIDKIKEILIRLVRSLVESLERMDIRGRTVVVKWRYPDFRTVTRSRSFSNFTRDYDVIRQTTLDLFVANAPEDVAVRLLGVGLSNLDTESNELQLELTLDS